MAKIYGLFGSMTGKVADVVMAVRNGEQIARKYQPVVTNPNTPAQVETRAKLKLISQLSAVMAPVIAIPRKGSVSSRNGFVKKNYGFMTYTEQQADVELAKVQLTESVVAMPSIVITRGESATTASISDSSFGTNLDVDRVVYAMFVRQGDGALQYVGSRVITDKGDGTWPAADFPGNTYNDIVVLAYGVRDNTERAKAVFSNMTVTTATAIANVIVTRQLTEADITLTETRGALSAAQA